MATYQPFGQTQIVVNALTQNLRLPGQYADAETGYYHNGFRDYDPTLRRYLKSDPIGLLGGLNIRRVASIARRSLSARRRPVEGGGVEHAEHSEQPPTPPVCAA
jgi:RHS repeat-associated protein